MFDQLRTKEQLGYDIQCDYKNTTGILGFCISAIIQADKYTTEYVDMRIEEFLKSFAETLEKTTEDELCNFKETLKKKKLCADVHLKQEVDRNWFEIEMAYYMFNRLERDVIALESITLDELRQWYAAHMQNGEIFRKLSVHVIGNVSNGAAIPETHENANVLEPEILSSEFLLKSQYNVDILYCSRVIPLLALDCSRNESVVIRRSTNSVLNLLLSPFYSSVNIDVNVRL